MLYELEDAATAMTGRSWAALVGAPNCGVPGYLVTCEPQLGPSPVFRVSIGPKIHGTSGSGGRYDGSVAPRAHRGGRPHRRGVAQDFGANGDGLTHGFPLSRLRGRIIAASGKTGGGP